MSKQDIIIEKLDKILELLGDKKNIEPLLTFSKANNSVDDKFIKEREKELFKILDDNKRGDNNVK